MSPVTGSISRFCEPGLAGGRILSVHEIPKRLAKEHLIDMIAVSKPYLHLAINAVDTVVFDPEGLHDSDRSDRYESFGEARDAALSSVEVMLDLEDYDDDQHRDELELMRGLLDTAASFDELKSCTEYLWFLKRLVPAHQAA